MNADPAQHAHPFRIPPSHGSEPERGVLYIVSTPIGNMEDITLRALRILSRVDLIAAEDTRTTRHLLEHYGITTHCISYFSRNERRRIPQLIEELHSGRSLAVVSDAGTPAISDPAALLISEAVRRDIRVVSIPGASALLAGLVASGLSTDGFIFEGFLPIKKRRSTRINRLATETRTIVLYESPHRIIRTIRDLHSALGERHAVVCRELTKKYEEFIRGTFSEILEHLLCTPVRGEFVLIIEGLDKKTALPEEPDE